MKMNRPRSLLISIGETQNILQIKVYKSTDSKSTSHYDTLQVKVNCTQNEVKAAYYKLSKQYHPDVNNTKEAKRKFQNISDAYDILGNFHKRKLYDRDLITRGKSKLGSVSYNMHEDPVASFYRSKLSKFDHLKLSNQKVYNFDEWTQNHYQEIFKRNLKLKKNKISQETLDAQFEENTKKATSSMWILSSGLIFTSLALILQTYMNYRSYDKNYIDKRNKK